MDLRFRAKMFAMRLKGYLRMLIAVVGFALIFYGAWSGFKTWQAAGGRAAVNSQNYLQSLVAVDLLIIGAGAAIVLLASR